MTRKIIASSVIACFLIQAYAQQKAKVGYSFPPEMAAPVKAEYVKMWEKGQVLYELNCAKCHNKTIKGQVVIPDFTPEQLKGYEIRVLNKEHEEDMPDEKVTAEELILISTFLSYKTKNSPEVNRLMQH